MVANFCFSVWNKLVGLMYMLQIMADSPCAQPRSRNFYPRPTWSKMRFLFLPSLRTLSGQPSYDERLAFRGSRRHMPLTVSRRPRSGPVGPHPTRIRCAR